MDRRLKDIMDNYEQLRIGLDETFQFHCKMCGKCCINREDIILTPRDVYNMAKFLCIEPIELFKRYCESYIGSESKIPIVRLKPRGSIKRCPLLKDKKCSVHNAKPAVCAMYPIGRCALLSEDKKESIKDIPKTEYIFLKPDCGDDSETHTVREWLNIFEIPLEDSFFYKWQSTIVELGSIFRKAEKVLKPEEMRTVWNLTACGLYFDYDTNKAFMPQFIEITDKLLSFLKSLPLSKGGIV